MGRDAGELAGVGAIGTAVVDGLSALEHARVDVIVDFSVPAVTLALAPIAAATNSAIVSGTTGLHDEVRQALARAADRVPVLWEPNMSVGVHVLSQLVAQAVTALADWDIEILVETHHRAKVDAPRAAPPSASPRSRSARAPRPLASRTPRARASSTAARESPARGPPTRSGCTPFAAATSSATMPYSSSAAPSASSSRTARRGAATSSPMARLRAARWIARKPAGTYALRDILGR